jgi:RNA polymerase sigma factor (sigma-70 family)
MTVMVKGGATMTIDAPRFDHLGESRLVARVTAGDERALGELYDRYGGYVHGLARRVTGSPAIAADVTQEVFVHLWQRPDTFDPDRGTVRAWIGVIAHRRAVDRVRSETRRAQREQRALLQRPDPVVDVATTVTDTIGDRDLSGKVRELVAALPPDQRQAIELAYFDGCTYREVAVRLGIAEGTAKSRLRLALAKLSALATSQGLEQWI